MSSPTFCCVPIFLTAGIIIFQNNYFMSRKLSLPKRVFKHNYYCIVISIPNDITYILHFMHGTKLDILRGLSQNNQNTLKIFQTCNFHITLDGVMPMRKNL